jgi:hypothetical protein
LADIPLPSCDEIAAVAISEFDTESKSTRRPIESGKVVDGLGKLMGSWKGNALGAHNPLPDLIIWLTCKCSSL